MRLCGRGTPGTRIRGQRYNERETRRRARAPLPDATMIGTRETPARMQSPPGDGTAPRPRRHARARRGRGAGRRAGHARRMRRIGRRRGRREHRGRRRQRGHDERARLRASVPGHLPVRCRCRGGRPRQHDRRLACLARLRGCLGAEPEPPEAAGHQGRREAKLRPARRWHARLRAPHHGRRRLRRAGHAEHRGRPLRAHQRNHRRRGARERVRALPAPQRVLRLRR